MKSRILKSTLKGLFLNIIIKSQQYHPSCLPILICTVRKKESNIFMYIIIYSAKTYLSKLTLNNNDISSNITFFGAVLKRLELPAVIIFKTILTFLQSLIHRLKDKLVFCCNFDYHYTFLPG